MSKCEVIWLGAADAQTTQRSSNLLPAALFAGEP